MSTRNYTINDTLYIRFRQVCLLKKMSASKIIRELIQKYVDEHTHFEDIKDDDEGFIEENKF